MFLHLVDTHPFLIDISSILNKQSKNQKVILNYNIILQLKICLFTM